MDQADNALSLWKTLGIQSAHIVSHDMGDSVMTEILTRKMKGQLPSYFDNFFKASHWMIFFASVFLKYACLSLQSITFTNGGMRISLANLRITQSLLTTPIVKDVIWRLQCLLPVSMHQKLIERQLGSIWSPNLEEASVQQRDQDIQDMVSMVRYNGGRSVMVKTISYLNDRWKYYFNYEVINKSTPNLDR